MEPTQEENNNLHNSHANNRRKVRSLNDKERRYTVNSSSSIKYLTNLLPNFIATFLLLKTKCIVTIITFRPYDECFLNQSTWTRLNTKSLQRKEKKISVKYSNKQTSIQIFLLLKMNMLCSLVDLQWATKSVHTSIQTKTLMKRIIITIRQTRNHDRLEQQEKWYSQWPVHIRYRQLSALT